MIYNILVIYNYFTNAIFVLRYIQGAHTKYTITLYTPLGFILKEVHEARSN